MLRIFISILMIASNLYSWGTVSKSESIHAGHCIVDRDIQKIEKSLRGCLDQEGSIDCSKIESLIQKEINKVDLIINNNSANVNIKIQSKQIYLSLLTLKYMYIFLLENKYNNIDMLNSIVDAFNDALSICLNIEVFNKLSINDIEVKNIKSDCECYNIIEEFCG